MRDCLIIGGGPAGLTAALYLARFNRDFVLVDAGESRAAWIPATHNFPLFSHGVAGKQMLALQRDHLGAYGVTPLAGTVTALRQTGSGFAAQLAGEQNALEARHVLLATGATDIEPRMPDLGEALRRGLLRYCPICDGYEARGKKIAVIGFGDRGLGEAIFMARSYAHDVTLLTLGEGISPSRAQREKLQQHQIKLVETPIAALEIDQDRIAAIRMNDGQRHLFETLYAALGLHVRSELALCLGAAHTKAGALRVDDHCETTIPGLYAAGDAVEGLNQIVVAMGHAAIAATAIHNRCVSEK